MRNKRSGLADARSGGRVNRHSGEPESHRDWAAAQFGWQVTYPTAPQKRIAASRIGLTRRWSEFDWRSCRWKLSWKNQHGASVNKLIQALRKYFVPTG